MRLQEGRAGIRTHRLIFLSIGKGHVRPVRFCRRAIRHDGQRLAALDRLRETLGYRETLRRGYAVVRSDGDIVTDTATAKAAGALEIEFADGRVTAAVAGGPSPKGKKAKAPPDQGSLF